MKKIKYFLFVALLYFSSVIAIGYIESNNPNGNIKDIGDAFWFAIVTLTTVGYGDLYPVTVLGKIIGLVLILGSIGILGIIISEITNKINSYMEKKKNGFFGTDFENHYIIIGYNDFALQVGKEIISTGHKIAFLTDHKDNLEKINSHFNKNNCFSLYAEYKDEENYSKLNFKAAKSVFINFEKDADTLVFVLNAKKAYPQIEYVALCNNTELKGTFENAGIKHVVSPLEVTSKLVASYIFEPEVATYTEDLISSSKNEEDSDIQQYKIIADSFYQNKSFNNAFHELKDNYNAIAIGVVKNNKVYKNPSSDYILSTNDYIILISNGASKQGLEKLFGIKEGK